jgi:hypothetical protein
MRAGKRYLNIVRWALLCILAPKYAQLTWALFCTLAPKYSQFTWAQFCTFAQKYTQITWALFCTLAPKYAQFTWARFCTFAQKYTQITWALFFTLAPKYAQLTWTLFCTFAPKYAELATYYLCTISTNVLLNRQSLSKFWVQISTKRSAIFYVFFDLAHSKKSPPVRPQPLPSKSLPSHYSLNITRSELLTVSSITCYIGNFHCDTKTVFWNVKLCRL